MSPIIAWLVLAARSVRAWWRIDRVRVSETVGALYRLRAGSLVSVRGADVEVVSRDASPSAPSTIIYGCESANGPCQLHVQAAELDGPPILRLLVRGAVRELAVEDVQVWR